MTIVVPIGSLGDQLMSVLEKVEAGETVVLTRDGAPLMRLEKIASEPIRYGDLRGVYLADDLELPDDLRDYEPPEFPQ